MTDTTMPGHIAHIGDTRRGQPRNLPPAVTGHADAMSSLLRDLVSAAAEPTLSDASRASRARTAAETAADLLDLVRHGTAVLGGGRAVDLLRSLRSTNPAAREAAGERLEARQVLDELRDSIGPTTTPVDVGTGTTGIGEGMPLIRRYALRRNVRNGPAMVVPGFVGGDIDGTIDPPLDGTFTGNTLNLVNVGADESWHMAAVFANIARQLLDDVTSDGAQLLDQALEDVADGAAEDHIGAELVAAAGGTRAAAAGALADALDDADSAASTALQAPADLYVCAPGDVARVRRALPLVNDDVPRPMVAASRGVPAGTTVVTGRNAFHLFALEPITDAVDEPSAFGKAVAVMRFFYLAIRSAPAVQTVTGI